MKKKFIIWLAASIVVMLIFPFIAIKFINGDSAMACCFILFYGVNPIYSIVVGIFAGESIKELWSLPIISAALFLLGVWIFFDFAETAFLLYAAIYLIIGIIAMLVSMLQNRKLNKFK